MIGTVVIALLFSAAAPESKAPRKPAPKKATAARPVKPVPPPLKIPEGARQVEPGTWAHTDAQGKRWIYRETPFGISRMEEQAPAAASPLAAARAADPSAGVTAKEDGDSIHFTRPGPFGTYKWTKKKGELNEEEEAVWKRERAETKPE
jgi:hypothetical protein